MDWLRFGRMRRTKRALPAQNMQDWGVFGKIWYQRRAVWFKLSRDPAVDPRSSHEKTEAGQSWVMSRGWPLGPRLMVEVGRWQVSPPVTFTISSCVTIRALVRASTLISSFWYGIAFSFLTKEADSMPKIRRLGNPNVRKCED